MKTTLFTDYEIIALKKRTKSIQDQKIRKRLEEYFGEPSYQALSIDEKLAWLNNEVSKINSNTRVNSPLVIFGLFISAVIGSAVGGFVGFVVFFVVFGFFCAIGTKEPKEAILRPYLDAEIKKITKQQKEIQAREKEAEEAAIEQKRKAEEAERDLHIRELASKSQKMFDSMKKQPSLIPTKFSEYRDNVALEIQYASPGQEHIDSNTAVKKFANGVLIGSLGVWTDGYIPAKDEKCFRLIKLLSLEKKRLKELATVSRLPFMAIEYFQEISRNYYGLHREGGSASMYDEQLITNEVMAMKESLVVQGDYLDKSLHLDRSVTHTTQIHNAVIDNGEYDEQRIKKEILKIIISSEEEASSRAELMASIPVKESRLLAALEELQHKGMLQIGNRPSGEVVYRLDRLA